MTDKVLTLGAFNVLVDGFPLSSSRGALGWATIVLFEVNDKLMLFDAGSHGDAMVLRDSLERFGYHPNQVDGIVLSHLHYDHASGIARFPNAAIFLSSAEVHYAQAVDANPWLDPGLDAAAFRAIKSERLRIVDGGHDFGGVEVIALPGHTPGSIGLLDPTARVVCTGDSLKNYHDLIRGSLRKASDPSQAQTSIARLRALEDHWIIPGHDQPFIHREGKVTFGSSASVTIVAETIDGAGQPQSRSILIRSGTGLE